MGDNIWSYLEKWKSVNLIPSMDKNSSKSNGQFTTVHLSLNFDSRKSDLEFIGDFVLFLLVISNIFLSKYEDKILTTLLLKYTCSPILYKAWSLADVSSSWMIE